MLYYHGSPHLFDKPDPNQSTCYIKTFHVTPHRALAEIFAWKIPDQNQAYLYTIEVEGDTAPYHEGACNIQFSNTDQIKIIKVEVLLKK